MAELTPKQAQFVREYLVDLNGKQAAVRAGYKPKTAEVQASRLLTYAKVKDAIEKAQQKRAARVELSQDFVINKLLEVAELSMAALQYAAANKSLELLGKHIGMFREKVDLDGSMEIRIVRKVVSNDRD